MGCGEPGEDGGFGGFWSFCVGGFVGDGVRRGSLADGRVREFDDLVVGAGFFGWVWGFLLALMGFEWSGWCAEGEGLAPGAPGNREGIAFGVSGVNSA